MGKIRLLDEMKSYHYLFNTCVPEIRRKKAPDVKGTYSYCYYYGNYVVLKNIDKYETMTDYREEQYKLKKEVLDNLIEAYKINTPRLCACFSGKHHFYELQERAPGNALSIYYPSTARAITYGKGVLDDSHTRSELEREGKIEYFEKNDIGNAMFRYNSQMQSMLKACDTNLYIKFVRDFKILMQQGVSIDDSRSENFLFDKNNGFSFVDLAVTKKVEEPVDVSDYEVAKKIYSAFADFTAFTNCMNANQQKTIFKNMDVIHDRIYKAIKKCNFSLTPEQDAHLQSKSSVSGNFLNNMRK